MAVSRHVGGLILGAVMLATLPARAQLGSVNNPPPQHLFNMDQPRRLDTGLGTMAERRAQLGRSHGVRRLARHR